MASGRGARPAQFAQVLPSSFPQSVSASAYDRGWTLLEIEEVDGQEKAIRAFKTSRAPGSMNDPIKARVSV